MSVKNQINMQEAQTIAEYCRPAYNFRQRRKIRLPHFPRTATCFVFLVEREHSVCKAISKLSSI